MIDSDPSSQSARRVLLTGGTGFIGAQMAGALVARGDEVVALVRHGSDATALEELGVRVVRGDLTRPSDVRGAAEGCALIHHLAAATSRLGIRSQAEYEAANVTATANVMRAAVEAGVPRVVHCSSGGIYGKLGSRVADEDTPPRPDNAYRRSKLRAEEVVREWVERHGLGVSIGRPGIVYGPGSLNWLPFFRDLARGRLRMIGDGAHRYALTYVSDVVDGLIACEQPRATGRTYVLVAEPVPTLAEALEAMSAAVGVPFAPRRLPALPFVVLGRALGGISALTGRDLAVASRIDLFTQPRAYSGRRAREELGFRSRVGLEEGMRRTVAWLRAGGLLEGR